MSLPLLSAILPHHDPSRAQLCRKTVNNFVRQNYLPFELIVVNGTDTPIVTNDAINGEEYKADGCVVKEIFVPSGNAATMRNHGIQEAVGDWIAPIDNDDWFHPQRFLYQMAHRVPKRPCLLENQLKMDISPLLEMLKENQVGESFRPMLHLESNPKGIPSTMIFPRVLNDSEWRYDESLNVGEHAELLDRMRQKANITPVVCPNRHTQLITGLSWPVLSVAMYHGTNELEFNQFFEGLPEPRDVSLVPSGLNQKDVDLIKTMLRSYNFSVN